MKPIKSKISPIKFMAMTLFVVFGFLMIAGSLNQSPKQPICRSTTGSCSSSTILIANNTGSSTVNKCGGGSQPVITSIDFGCKGVGSPITDLIFAIIRFLSDGVGIVVVGSIVVGGIQYIGSRGDPNATSHAINRIRSSVIALIIFIFAYAILDYLIPVGFFHQ